VADSHCDCVTIRDTSICTLHPPREGGRLHCLISPPCHCLLPLVGNSALGQAGVAAGCFPHGSSAAREVFVFGLTVAIALAALPRVCLDNLVLALHGTQFLQHSAVVCSQHVCPAGETSHTAGQLGATPQELSHLPGSLSAVSTWVATSNFLTADQHGSPAHQTSCWSGLCVGHH